MQHQGRHEERISYRGHSLINACLADWPRRLLLMTADLWSTHFVVRGIEWPGGEPGNVPGNGWVVTTDVASVHTGVGGGFSFTESGHRAWEYSFTPGIPGHARSLEVAVSADAGVGLVVNVSPIVGQAHDELARSDAEPRSDEPCFGCAAVPRSTLRIRSCSSVDLAVADALEERSTGLPSELIPLGVDFGRYGGAERVVCGIELWPSSFDLLLEARVPPSGGGATPYLGGTWSLHDDVGNRYVGVAKTGGSFLSESVRVVCCPELHAKASVLAATFLDPFGGDVELGAAIALEDGQRRSPLAVC